MRRRRGGRRRWRWPSTRGAWIACAPCSAGADPLRDKTRLSLRVAGVDVATAKAYVGALTTLAITRPEDVAAELAACVAAAPSSAVARVLQGGRARARARARRARRRRPRGTWCQGAQSLGGRARRRHQPVLREVRDRRAAPRRAGPAAAAARTHSRTCRAAGQRHLQKEREEAEEEARLGRAPGGRRGRRALENADASLAHFDELAAAIDDEGEAEPLDEIELAAVAAAEEGIGAKTLRRGLAAVQAAEEAGVDAVARARELEAVLSEFAQPDVETVSLDANDDDATTDDTDADGADPAVKALLTRLDLVRFLDTFRENEVDAASLPKLTSADLAEMRIPIGPSAAHPRRVGRDRRLAAAAAEERRAAGAGVVS